jgi:hypothetical protein
MRATVSVVAQRVGGGRRRRCRGGASRVVGVKLDYFELHADAGLPAGRLVFSHMANGVRLLPAEASTGLRLADGLGLREDDLLLIAAMDVVAGGDGGRPRWDEVLVVAAVRDGEPRCTA